MDKVYCPWCGSDDTMQLTLINEEGFADFVCLNCKEKFAAPVDDRE